LQSLATGGFLSLQQSDGDSSAIQPSGSLWSGQLAAAIYTLLMTVKLHKINPRTWLLAYLQACCDAGNRAPQDSAPSCPGQCRHLSWQ